MTDGVTPLEAVTRQRRGRERGAADDTERENRGNQQIVGRNQE